MEKKAATELIEKTFNARFDIEQYSLFMRNLLNDYDEQKERDWAQGNYIYESFREHINRFKRLGIYTDPEGNEVELLVIETKATAKLERARTSLRNFVIKRLNDKNRDYALAAFYSKEDNGADWRFSYIKIEHESYKDAKGKVKTKKELTPAKRFSFLVGEHEHAYTAQKQLLPVLQNDYSNPNIEDLESCFSIEKVTDEFFEQYKELYLKLSEHFSTDKAVQKILVASGIDSARFTKKLLGQIVFLYFLQKKGWLGVPKNEPWGKGDKKFVQSLFDEANTQKKNFFKDYLQYLFYEALAKARTNSPDPAYYKRFNCKIPFLNGGLFEADYEWQKVDLTIPNELFRKKEKKGSETVYTGILDVFDRYNFTIKEDEPLEKEVAVDPEMLGKVFENMLEITERKSKGAFYTPREIVHYMCQESLINYLDNAVNDAGESYQGLDSDQLGLFSGAATKKGQTKLGIEHKGKTTVPLTDIETFVRKGFLATENDQTIIEKGKETSSYKFQLPETVRTNADELDKHLTSIKICDPAIGSGAFPVGLLHELVTAQKVLLPYLSEGHLKEKLKAIDLDKAEFKKDPAKYIYRVKRHAIQESIYGVDIDASAIDIARLRLWLSLIVDEEDFYSIEALPNLDYKIVKGNSLIGFPEKWTSPAFDKIEALKLKFFNETDSQTKKKLKTEIDSEINQQLLISKKIFGYEIHFDFKLFFSEVWHYKGGFDIVVGNPPYIKARDNNIKEERKIIDTLFDTTYKMWDTYIPFVEQGIRKINRRAGVCTMIIPDTIGVADYSMKLVDYIENQNHLESIVFFPNQFVFTSASVKSKIVIISKNKGKNSPSKRFEYADGDYKLLPPENGNNKYLFQVSKISMSFPNTISLGEACYVSYGLRLNSDKTDPDKFEKKDLISETKTKIHVKKYTEGKYLERYKINKTFWLEWNTERSPARLVRATFPELYKFPKLLLARQKKIAAFSEPGLICDNTIIVCVPHKSLSQVNNSNTKKYYKNLSFSRSDVIKSSEKFDLNYLLAIINSTLVKYFLKFQTNDGIDVFPDDWKKVPIFNADSKVQQLLSTLVDYLSFLLLEVSSEKIMTNYFDALIDAIVFELYYPNSFALSKKQVFNETSQLPSLKKGNTEIDYTIIKKEFNRLYDPNHPVRNNIETLDSVEEVRIIKEALK